MSITLIAGSTNLAPTVQQTDGQARMRQAFQQLSSALDAGDLTAAKEALAQLPTPAASGKSTDPIAAQLAALTKAVAAGDLTTARKAYTAVKQTLAQYPAGGARPGDGAPKANAGTVGSSAAKTYDARDTDKDGTVSVLEEMAFVYKQTDAAKTALAPVADAAPSAIDLLA